MGANRSKELSYSDLEFLTKHTNLDVCTVKQKYVEFCQDYPDGKLTKERFYELYKLFYPSRPDQDLERFCSHVFRTYDTDQSGYMDFMEFLMAINMTSGGTPEEKLKWAFKMYDIDHNGVINQHEMGVVFQSIFEMSANGDLKPGARHDARMKAKAIFAKLDKNGDGELSEKEFVDGCLKDDKVRLLLSPIGLFDTPMASNNGHRKSLHLA